jgi:hypothetical protein
MLVETTHLHFIRIVQHVVFIFQRESYFFPSPQLSSTVRSNLPVRVRLRVAAVKRSSSGRSLLQKYKFYCS